MDKFDQLAQRFSTGDISQASKLELEQYAVLLSRPNASTRFPGSQFPQVCDTVRNLLIVRISEQANIEATRISTIALRVALVALVIAVVQTVATVWPLIFPPAPTVATPSASQSKK